MLRTDLIKNQVKESSLLEQKNIIIEKDFINKSLYYNTEVLTKSVPVNTGNLSARELLGTQIVFPSDDASKEGGYLIYLSPSFARGRTVYKLYDSKKNEQRKNTLKVKDSSLDNYVYQVDPNADPAELTEEGEPIPEVENTDRAVQKNREVKISPKSETESPEEYQDRFMKEYHELVRDINGALQDIDPELVRKQWAAKAKEQEIKEKQQESIQLVNKTRGSLEELKDCLQNQNKKATKKSILNFKTLLKAVHSLGNCASKTVCTILRRSMPNIDENLKNKLIDLINAQDISIEKIEELTKQFNFIQNRSDLVIYADPAEEADIRNELCVMMLLDLIENVDEKLYAEFYEKFVESKATLQMILQVNEAGSDIATIEDISENPKTPVRRLNQLIGVLKHLTKFNNLQEMKEILQQYNKGKINIFSSEAGSFIASMLGLTNSTPEANATIPSYLGNAETPETGTILGFGSNPNRSKVKKLKILDGIENIFPDISLAEIFDDAAVFNSNNERIKYIFAHIANNITKNFGCDPKSKEPQCRNLKAAIINYLSIKRSVLYDQDSINTPSGEFFENLNTLEILNRMIKDGNLLVDTLSYNNYSGIDALTNYLKCTAPENAKVLKEMKNIFGPSTDKEIIKLTDDERSDKSAKKEINKYLQDTTFRKSVLGTDGEQRLLQLTDDFINQQEKDKQATLLKERDVLRENLLKAAFLKFSKKDPKKSLEHKAAVTEQKEIVDSFYEEQNFSKILSELDLYEEEVPIPAAKRMNRQALNNLTESSPQTTSKKKTSSLTTTTSNLITTTKTKIPIVPKGLRKQINSNQTRSPVTLENKIKNGDYTLSTDKKQITVYGITFDIAPEEIAQLPPQKPTNLPKTASFIFLDNLIVKSIFSTSDCPIIDTDNPNKNTNAFLKAEYGKIEEDSKTKNVEGVYFIGFSKTKGIDGASSGFGDVAFLQVENAYIDQATNTVIQSPKKDAIKINMHVYEAKLVKDTAVGINFNAFGRFIGCAQMLINQIKINSNNPPEMNLSVMKFQGSIDDLSIQTAKAELSKSKNMAGKFILNFNPKNFQYGRNLNLALKKYDRNDPNFKSSYRDRAGLYVKNLINGIKRGSNLEGLFAFVIPEYAVKMGGRFSKNATDAIKQKVFDVLMESSDVNDFVDRVKSLGITLDLTSTRQFIGDDSEMSLEQRLKQFFTNYRQVFDTSASGVNLEAINAAKQVQRAFALKDIPYYTEGITSDNLSPKPGILAHNSEYIKELKKCAPKLLGLLDYDTATEDEKRKIISVLSGGSYLLIASFIESQDPMIKDDKHLKQIFDALTKQIEKLSNGKMKGSSKLEILIAAHKSNEVKRAFETANNERKKERNNLFMPNYGYLVGSELNKFSTIADAGTSRLLLLLQIFESGIFPEPPNKPKIR